MLVVLKALAVLYAMLGVFFLTSPDGLRGYVRFWRTPNRLYLGGAVAALIGVVFLLSASQCRWPLFFWILGALAVIKGILIFVFGLEKMMPLLDWYQKQSDAFLRFIGVLAVVIGVFGFLAV